MKEKPRKATGREHDCFECLGRVFDDGTRPLICPHCGAVVAEKVEEVKR